ncbi:TonB-dependent hemoglobin/transferrin/lactoferrin family receptor [Maritimibacter sp. 55A14]|uniref:TonB-dependent hemoglobin/transferrin/lactoferrin family receptor n=1 Tax=Maritimibacter sp. 55A14 TaxID=2174844 RepID=UPI0011B26AD4|nr:TonB-dependent hemoglobin/transferrin/lactoferrin family receptor [Maritimibacter sp. 55A14]
MKNYVQISVSAAICCTLQAGGAMAQQTLDLPVITIFGGARDERALFDTPNAASVVGEQEVIRRQPSTYEELIGDEPGLTIEGGPRGVSQEINIRGFQDEQVVLRLDGARQNFNLAHRGRFFTDPMILKQAEVLRGGASTLFGSGALGGVVFLDTKDAADIIAPGRSTGAQAKLGYNSNGNEFLSAGTVAAKSGPFDVLLFGAYRPRSDDIRDGNGDDIIDSAIDSQNYLAKFGLEPSEGLRLEFSHQHYQDEGRTPPNTNAQGSATTSVDRDLDYDTTRLNLEWNPSGNSLINLDTLLYYNNTKVEEDRIFDGRFDTTDFETLGFEATNISKLDLGLPVTMAYGVEIYRDEQEATRDGVARAQVPDARQTFYAAFAQAEVPLSSELTLTTGLRFDAFETEPEGGFPDRSGDKFSPKVALSWRPAEDSQIYASASRSFRAASLTEMFPQGVHFSVPGFPLGGPGSPTFTGVNEFQPSPDLRPETADQIELGARHRIRGVLGQGDRLDLAANVYYARVDDFIDTVVTFIDFSTFDPVANTVNGSTTSRNIDAELYGLEASAEYDADRWFTSASLTIPRGDGRNGAGKLGSIPQDRLVLTGGLRPLPALEIGARGTFLRGLDADDLPDGSQPVGGASVFDIFANYAPQTGPLEGAVLAAGVDNILDKGYRVHPNGLNSPGVTFKLAASMSF